jgi:hypothetical protein
MLGVTMNNNKPVLDNNVLYCLANGGVETCLFIDNNGLVL